MIINDEKKKEKKEEDKEKEMCTYCFTDEQTNRSVDLF
jgi:hypothetical protein